MSVPDRDELAAWLRLVETPGIGRDSARKLLAAFGPPQAVFEHPPDAWREVVPPAQATALARPREDLAALVESTRQWLAADAHRHVLTLGDPAYPRLLLETADPPLLLYAAGRLELLQAPSIAVVGSRHATAQGLENARAFAAHLSRGGLTVVSGLAAGIDGAAHEGALEGAGSTIAVVGTGLDRVYPTRHAPLAARIAAEGLLLSEYPLGMPPLAGNFPRRNRIISGLALGTLVVEAALQSGSLITARLALEQGREVFAIPGSIHAPQSRGCHALIKQGAKLVESAQDILEELHLPAASASPPPDAAPEPPAAEADDPVLAALGHDPATLDALVARTGWPAAQLNARLLELELEGRVARLPGQLFQRVDRG
ncbi:DNA-protecting protein DprA [Caldimonas thermodepolymerans]|uniref:DNA-protecting protein DprA n=1 Tax=Caldimonas thermodepolymerans TaxID=215580 RepID=A0A2S5T0T9_9BURK|nr:DNA-processing protein DprA [Caldimonas thermodepolymerans]PPE68593.1 DNA-protecting protein DprA [Caldimonas thermodepolymerans]QPC32005.1 DNA-protecting protein DprA [Caldimonas thermodepolymerans]RDI01469.1 DNA protecting protein DprA [Caldimonas thermodepolymerans]TCP08357.1 DNA protecting protein DprA [Caldimonas thermodepolymerans]UZG48531.1 DNA-processing protein DprA [Caldimonas thermodepolymerans]